MTRLTREWVRKAEADLAVAWIAARQSDPMHDAGCFHCQQCAEKYLKALLQELGLRVPRTHELLDLRSDLRPHHPSLGSLRRGLEFLTQFAVEFRYPGEDASKRQSEAALPWAERVRTAARALLGIRERRRKK
jgi:HEPN domain-containing protein